MIWFWWWFFIFFIFWWGRIWRYSWWRNYNNIWCYRICNSKWKSGYNSGIKWYFWNIYRRIDNRGRGRGRINIFIISVNCGYCWLINGRNSFWVKFSISWRIINVCIWYRFVYFWFIWIVIVDYGGDVKWFNYRGDRIIIYIFNLIFIIFISIFNILRIV